MTYSHLLKNQQIQLKIGEQVIGKGNLDSHINNSRFDIFFRIINKNEIQNLFEASEIYFKINEPKSLLKDLKCVY